MENCVYYCCPLCSEAFILSTHFSFNNLPQFNIKQILFTKQLQMDKENMWETQNDCKEAHDD